MSIKKLYDFIDWMQQYDKVSKDSAESYDSYVRNAFIAIDKEITNVNNTNALEAVISYFSQQNVAVKHNKSPKTISNYVSGLRMYAEYLYQTSTDTDVEELFDIEITDSLCFEKKDLYKVFVFRLITQDRFYQEIFFPISLVKQILYSSNNTTFFDSFITNILDNTIIHTDKEEVKLIDVDFLRVENESVYVGVNKNLLKVLTPTQTAELIPFKAKDLRNVSLDHITSQHSIMHQLKDELTAFKSLTDLLQNTKPFVTNRPTLNAFKKSYGLENIVTSIDINALMKELELIGSHIQLQFMDRSMNTSKGKN